MDIVDLRDYYLTPLGQASAKAIASAVAESLRPAVDQSVLGIGYVSPLFDILLRERDTTLSFMLARQGVIHWPVNNKVRSALVDASDLPLSANVVDFICVMHGLELADSPLDMLQELWRVLTPQGRLILVVPNRRGIWAASDRSPFGQGQPYSRRQLGNLLKEAMFSVQSMRPALFIPPTARQSLLRGTQWLEKTGPYLMPHFAGVTIVEAMKQVYAFTPGKRVRRLVPRLRPAMLPAPQGAALQNQATVPMTAEISSIRE
jgi:SAM-dependent methyltransferase